MFHKIGNYTAVGWGGACEDIGLSDSGDDIFWKYVCNSETYIKIGFGNTGSEKKKRSPVTF